MICHDPAVTDDSAIAAAAAAGGRWIPAAMVCPGQSHATGLKPQCALVVQNPGCQRDHACVEHEGPKEIAPGLLTHCGMSKAPSIAREQLQHCQTVKPMLHPSLAPTIRLQNPSNLCMSEVLYAEDRRQCQLLHGQQLLHASISSHFALMPHADGTTVARQKDRSPIQESRASNFVALTLQKSPMVWGLRQPWELTNRTLAGCCCTTTRHRRAPVESVRGPEALTSPAQHPQSPL